MMATYMDEHGDFVVMDEHPSRRYVAPPAATKTPTGRRRYATREEIGEVLAEVGKLGGVRAASRASGVPSSSLDRLRLGYLPRKETVQEYMRKLKDAALSEEERRRA